MSYRIDLLIAYIPIELSLPYDPQLNPLFSLFRVPSAIGDPVRLIGQLTDSLPSPVGKCCGRIHDCTVYYDIDTDRVFRKNSAMKDDGALSVYGADDDFSTTYYTPGGFRCLTDERYLFHCLSLNQLLLNRNTFILHSSFIAVDGKAVLFSASSGTGKSTQAALWEQYRGAEIINGDKAAVNLINGQVFAHGVPFCGTSGICKNLSLPLAAIILLSKDSENRAEPLTGLRAVREVLKNVHLDLLAPKETTKAFSLMSDILSLVPVYSFACTKEESAVSYLYDFLKERGDL